MNNPYFDIASYHTALRNGELTVLQALEQYLKNVAENENLNAFITVSEKEARIAAQKVQHIIDTNPKAFDEYPLLGVIVALKDLYLTKGIKTTASSNVLSSFVPPYSATVVEKLEAAGAIIIGKTNCDAWAHGASGENSDFGPALNPWNHEYVPGGSSSGSAIAVSAQLSMVAMGTDTGGSIRQPAGFCNVVGFKPTYGAVSRYGVIAMASSLDTMGHFARTVADARRVFAVTKGKDSHDGTTHEGKIDTPRKKKIGIPKEYFIDGLDPEVKKAVDNAAKVYESLGYEIVDVSLPHTKYGISVYYIVQPAEVSSNLSRYDGVRFGNERGIFGDEAKRRIMLGTYVLSAGYYDAYYGKAMKVRTLICQDFEKVFEQVDAIISPISPTPPFKLGEKAADPLQMYLADVFTVNANLAGIPGLSVPAGFSKSGLPIGFQLLAPQFGEDILFDLGEAYQEKTDWHTKEPTT